MRITNDSGLEIDPDLSIEDTMESQELDNICDNEENKNECEVEPDKAQKNDVVIILFYMFFCNVVFNVLRDFLSHLPFCSLLLGMILRNFCLSLLEIS